MDFGAGLGVSKEAAEAAFSRQWDYFVAPWGSDSNSGYAGSPLRTFQEAVDRAGTGASNLIENDPTTMLSHNAESVVAVAAIVFFGLGMAWSVWLT